MRLHAEWDTYRRRTAEQREAEKARALPRSSSTSLLPVHRRLRAHHRLRRSRQRRERACSDGVRAVHSKLVDVLVKDGVEVIDPAGEPFDALRAPGRGDGADDAEAFDETVHEVYQKGYKHGRRRCMRPAMVTVTTGGPQAAPNGEEDDPDGGVSLTA